MKKYLSAPFLACVLLAGACTVSSPVGTWELDKPAMKAAATVLPAADVDRMLAGIGESTIELKPDGTAALRARVDFQGRTIEDSTTGTCSSTAARWSSSRRAGAVPTSWRSSSSATARSPAA